MAFQSEINNQFYNAYGDRWYTADDDPVALLRAETKIKVPWVLERIRKNHGEDKNLEILDVGCGAGFLTNALAAEGYRVTGVDLSESSLRVAARYDLSGRANYRVADARSLPFVDQTFDVVAAMDFLEHVEDPAQVIADIARVLKPGGLFFFQTLNRNLVSWLIAIKMVEWLVKNTPPHMHVLHLFIKPYELEQYCRRVDLQPKEIVGIRPKFSSIPLKNYFTGIVPASMQFRITKSKLISYIGYAVKA